jgi:polar amino acid transport system substrate-binding protein
MDSRQSPSLTTRARTIWRGGVGLALASTIALLALAGCGTTSGGGGSTTTGSNCPSAATQDTWKLVTPGKLTIITNSPYAPAEYPDPKDPTKIIGYDMDIANAIAQKMCLSLVINNTENFDSIIPSISGPALGNQLYDMSISSFTINDKRQEKVDMLPYFQAGQSLLLPPNNPAGITGELSTWCGKSIAVQDGTVELQQIQDINGGNNGSGEQPVCKSNNIKVLHYADQSVVVLQVVNGSADASFQDSPVSGYYAKLNSGKVVLGPVPNDPNAAEAPEGIVLRKDNTPLEDAVKAALAAIRADGSYASILAKWGQTNSAYPPLS